MNSYIKQNKMSTYNSSFGNSSTLVNTFTDVLGKEWQIYRERVNGYVQFNVGGMIFDSFQEVREFREELQSQGERTSWNKIYTVNYYADPHFSR